MSRIITFAEAGIAYQIRLENDEASIVACGPGNYRRSAIISQPDIARIVESPHHLAQYCEAALRRNSSVDSVADKAS